MNITREKLIAVLLLCGVVTAAAFLFADHITSSESLQKIVTTGGIFGAIAIALVSGLNFLVPVPPATFAPVFLEAGMSVWLVITGFVIGTTLADTIGYLFGWIGKNYAETAWPSFTKRLHAFMDTHKRLVLPLSFVYFAIAPLPNELILLPLALSGYAYRTLLIPMILGNVIHHTILVFGYQSVFEWVF